VRRGVPGSLLRAVEVWVAGVAGFRAAAAVAEVVPWAGFFSVSELGADSSDFVAVVAEPDRDDGESEFTKRCSCAS